MTAREEMLERTEREGVEDPGRRSFLGLALGAMAAALTGWFASIGLRYLWPPPELAGTKGGDGQTVIALSEVPIGDSKKLRHKGKAVIVVRTAAGVSAVSAVCTHLGCLVNWEADAKELVCPCHGAHFDLEGTVRGGPAPRALERIEAKIVGDQIVLGGGA